MLRKYERVGVFITQNELLSDEIKDDVTGLLMNLEDRILEIHLHAGIITCTLKIIM